MKFVGILGPTKFKKTKKLEQICDKISKILIKYKFGVIISPDKDTTAEFFAKRFKKNKNSFLLGIDYKDDISFGYQGLNRKICDKLINCETWENQPKEIVKNSGILIVLGFSVGVIWEICLTKFYWDKKGNKVLIIKELNKEKLPNYLNKSLPIKYISIKNLEKEHFC